MAHPLELETPEIVSSELINRYLDKLAKNPDYHFLFINGQGKSIVQRMRAQIWPERGANRINFRELKAQRSTEFTGILAELKDDDQLIKMLEVLAKCGHLYDIGCLLARDNFFAGIKAVGSKIPGGIEEYIESFVSAGEAVDALNQPHFEATFTAHPTNNNSITLMRSMRRLAECATEVRQQPSEANEKTLDKAIDEFTRSPLVPMNEQGEDTDLTVIDEANQMDMFLEYIWKDLALTYKDFDEQLSKKGDYDPLSLKLDMRFNAWGRSGDKDGNKKVNADTTLITAVNATLRVTQLYHKELLTIKRDALQGSVEALATKEAELEELAANLKTYQTEGKAISPRDFSKFSQALAAATPNMDGLIADLEANYRKKPSDPLLLLIRRARTFGAHLGRIEYRETSEELSRITALLIPGYDAMDEAARVQELTHILQTPGEAVKLLRGQLKTIVSKGANHNFDTDAYPADNPYAIAYHTFKRLELARDNPALVVKHVLAECQNVSNKLELKLLMDALEIERDGKKIKPILGIVPLYEDPHVMQKVGEIENASYANLAYEKHLLEFATAHPKEVSPANPRMQEVQFAHSDNRRRAGPAAAVGYIDEAHRLFREAAKKHGIDARSYEGGSFGDSFRNGVRAISSTIKEFNLYRYAKFTFQGGDLMNYFGVPGSSNRLFSRMMTNCAKHFNDPEPSLHLEDEPINFLAVKALEATFPDYEKRVFLPEYIGAIIGMGGFGKIEMSGGNVGSRRQRGSNDKVFKEVELLPSVNGHKGRTSFAAGAAVKVIAAKPDDIRTINFSELPQHSSVHPNVLGTQTLDKTIFTLVDQTRTLLAAKIKGKGGLSKEERELNKLLDTIFNSVEKHGEPTQVQTRKILQFLYSNAPAFRNMIDRMCFGIAMTDMDLFEELHPEFKHTQVWDGMRQEFIHAADIAFSAKDRKTTTIASQLKGSDVTAISQQMTDVLPHLRANITHRKAIVELTNRAKAEWMKRNPAQDPPLHLLRTAHCAIDTATHSRYLLADDPQYGQAKGHSIAGRV